MNWNSIMGFISSFAFFAPILLIIILRLANYKSFPYLLIYYSSVLMYNVLTEGYVQADENLIYYWGLTNNVIDTPLVLLFLTYFSGSKLFTKRMRLLVLSFVLFEAIVIGVIGFNVDSITIIMGPGLTLIIGFCLYFFIRNTRLAIEKRKATGKAVIVSSLLFAYGCYSLIYLLFYVFKAHVETDGSINEQSLNDTFLIYFLAGTVSTIVMCIGILIEQKRIQKLKELQITRKELSSIYGESSITVPLRTAMLDFDRDQWN